MKLLLKDKTLVHEFDFSGLTPLHVAAKFGNIVALEFLLDFCPKNEKNFHCANFKTKFGNWPLHIAIENKNVI